MKNSFFFVYLTLPTSGKPLRATSVPEGVHDGDRTQYFGLLFKPFYYSHLQNDTYRDCYNYQCKLVNNNTMYVQLPVVCLSRTAFTLACVIY